MSDFQNEMNRTVGGFVAQITELARRAAIDTLESAFGGRLSASNGHVTSNGAGRVGRPRGGGGAKRSPEDIEALSERIGSFVKANPGLRIEQINKQLGTTTKDLALPIRKLVSSGVIATKGEKRSTKYFAGKKAKN
jgi:hypothetical protein